MSVPIYWRNIRYRYRLIGTRCLKCGAVFYPPRRICPKCRNRKLEEIELPRKGKLITFTVVRSPPAGYERYAPYVLGVIELENGVKVIAQLTDVDINEVHTGMEVEAVFRKYRENSESGIIEYGIKFRPILKGS